MATAAMSWRLGALLTAVACTAASSAADAPTSSASPIARRVAVRAIAPAVMKLRRPEAPGDLVINLVAAVNGGMLADAETFGEPALTNLLGGDVFNWITNRRNLRMANIGHFPASYSAAARDAQYKIFVMFQVIDGQNQGQVLIDKLDPCIRITALLKLFGEGYSSTDAHAQEHAHPTLLNPRTSPDGNKDFDYEFSRDQVKTNMRFTTRADGAVEIISITQRGRQ